MNISLKNLPSIVTGGLSAAALFLTSSQPVSAVCPVCSVAVGAGLGLSRYFGIDDAISGVWVGGMAMSMTFWTVDWLKGRKISFPWLNWLTVMIAYYALIMIPLYISEIIGHSLNQLWGVDRLLVGTLVGSAAFVLGVDGDVYLRTLKSDGKAFFPYQKVVLPVAALALASLIMYLITKV